MLCGGLGTRLGWLTQDLPKTMVEVGGRPFLDRLLEDLAHRGLERVHLSLGYRAEQIVTHLSQTEAPLGLETTWAIEPHRLGTGGAVAAALPRLGDPALVLMGDTSVDLPYAEILASAPETPVSMVVTSHPSDVGPNVGLAGDTVVTYDKSGVPGGWTDTGVAVLRPRLLAPFLPEDPVFDLTVLYRSLLEAGGLGAVRVDQRFHDIGTPQGLERLERALDHCEDRDD